MLLLYDYDHHFLELNYSLKYQSYELLNNAKIRLFRWNRKTRTSLPLTI